MIPDIDPVSIALAALVVALISALLSLIAVVGGRRARRRRAAGAAPDEVSLAADVDRLAASMSSLERRLSAVEQADVGMIQRVGVVRFNPFPDTGGNQSFVVALLDARGNGVVLSSLHSRGGTRVYLKRVADGKAETALSEEESEAIRRAGLV